MAKHPWKLIDPAKNSSGFGFGLPPKEDMVAQLRGLADAIDKGEAFVQAWERADCQAAEDFAFDRVVIDIALVAKRTDSD